MAAAEIPKLSSSERAGPFAVELLISTVSFTVPSVFMNMMWRAPLLSPPASSL